MFTPIHLLPQNTADNWKYKTRWETDEGKKLHEQIIARIRQGAGENFLEYEFQAGHLGFLKDEGDLRGLQISKEDIVFPKGDNFWGVDFSFAEFWHSKFTNAVFYSQMHFTKFYNCTFHKCSFLMNHCYATQFEKVTFIDCDFVEHNTFTNCSFSDTILENTFFPSNVFYDCLFDSRTEFSSFPEEPVTHTSDNLRLHNVDKSDLYRAISEAYMSGRSHAIARRYRFLQLQSSTRYNTQDKHEKAAGFIFEYLSGYGLRPSRVIRAMSIYFLLALIIFASQIGFGDALLLTCGAIFTFGAKVNLLDKMGLFFHVVYILSSFVDISLTALFVTVLVNVFMGNKWQ